MKEDRTQPKYAQIYAKLKEEIQSGVWAAGSRLPSKRALAEQCGVSVVTVETAVGQLCAEGYIEARERSGYFVCRVPLPPSATAAVRRIVPLTDPPAEPPADSGFRYTALQKIMREVITEYGARLLDKPPHAGCAELRNALSEYLLRARGMYAEPARIIIGSGAEQLYGLVVQLLGRDRVYGLEYPSYEQIRLVYEANGATCDLLPLDSDGIATEALARTKADVLHVSPFHNFPTGVRAPAAKRAEYLAWASARNGWIVEDDFDSELAVLHRPIEPMYAMDREDCVIYLNTFSHSLAPSMRMGYMILPHRLTEVYERKLGFYTCSVPLFDQYVLAKFIARGHFERHLHRTRLRLRREDRKGE